MSRTVEAKATIKGCLIADSPISVGGGGAGDMVDIDLAIDGQGRYYIPGSSLAGPMRTWTEMNLTAVVGGNKLDGSDIADKLFGYMKKSVSDKEGYASFLTVYDAVVSGQSSVRERRHGISIDERSCTAREHFFYTRALLPKGTEFSFSMELDVAQCDREITAGALGRIIEALSNGEIRFGSCKTRGFGAMRLLPDGLEVSFYDFSRTDALDEWLEGRPSSPSGAEVFDACKKIVGRVPNQRHEIKICWAPISRIMVKSGREGIETDMLPLVSKRPGGISPVIPGTSIKGVLRSQACRIMRTIFGQRPEDDRDEAYLGIVMDMFGDKDKSGRVFVDDVYLSSVTGISEDEWIQEKEDKLNTITIHEDHVAIDRFTGGASEGALYSARPVPRSRTIGGNEREISWDPIKITVDFSSRLDKPDERSCKAELALIELLIRDMQSGLVPLGFGTNRGFGDIEIRCVKRISGYMDGNKSDDIKQAWREFVESGGKFQLAAEE
jgi:CRISPR/Cas system CSM-associated protein Csm3 (group 7 of RAMP superfamily)